MTCIVALEHEGEVWMGGDSLVTDGQTSDSLRATKVYRSGRGMLGHSGSHRRISVLRAETIKLDGGTWTERRVTLAVVPQMVELFEKHKIRHQTSGGGHDESGCTILCIGGRVFEIDDAMGVSRSRYGYAAIGSGARPALGLLSGTVGMDPRKRVRLALEAAERHTPTVRRPWTILGSGRNAAASARDH